MKKILAMIISFFKKVWSFIDKKVIIPITKIIHFVSSAFDDQGKQIETFLSKKNTILYVSLIVAVISFIAVDRRVIVFSQNTAEILRSQPVSVIYNEEAYVIEGMPSTVDITLIGSRADLYFAKQSPSNEVTIDVSDLSPGTHEVGIEYQQVLPSIDYKVNPSIVTINIYPKVSETRTISIDILNQDSLSEELIIKNVDIDEDKVVIKGAEHTLARVANVKALVDINNLTSQEVGKTTMRDIQLRAYDSNGDIVDVEIVPERMTAEIEIASPSRELPIRIIPVGEPSFGKAISSISSNVSNVVAYGDDEVLQRLRNIPIEIDVEGLSSNREYRVEIPKPVGVRTLSVNNITINVTLEDSVDRDVEGINIEYRNLKDGLIAQGLSREDIEIDVTLKGVESVVSEITASDITAYLDLEGFEEGDHEIDVEVEGSDLRVEYIPKTTRVRIRIVKR